MKLLEKLTSFNFVNERSYVHSSTIIEYIWQNIQQFIKKDNDYPVYMDIHFRNELKSNATILVYDESQDISKYRNLNVICKIYSKKINLFI